MKRNSLIIGLVAVLIAGGAALYFFVVGNSQLEWGGRSSSAPGQTGLSAFDPDDLNEIVPRSTYIVVGQVLEKLGAVRAPGEKIYTKFMVQPIRVLKGDVSEPMVIVQPGGMVDGEWQITDTKYYGRGGRGDADRLEDYLLKPGKTYLFIGAWASSYEWYGLYHSPVARADLGFEENASFEQIREAAMDHKKVKEVTAILESGMHTRLTGEIEYEVPASWVPFRSPDNAPGRPFWQGYTTTHVPKDGEDVPLLSLTVYEIAVLQPEDIPEWIADEAGSGFFREEIEANGIRGTKVTDPETGDIIYTFRHNGIVYAFQSTESEMLEQVLGSLSYWKPHNVSSEPAASSAPESGGTESLPEPQGTDDGGTWQDASAPDTEGTEGSASGE